MPFVHEGPSGGDMVPIKADWFDFVVLGTTLIHNVVADVAKATDFLDNIARAHANYRRMNAEAYQDMLKDIEAL